MTEKIPSSSEPTEHLLEKTVKIPSTEEVFDITQEIPREAIEAAQRQEILKEISMKTHTYQFLNYAHATRTGIEKKRGRNPYKKNKNDDSGIIGNNYLGVADGVGGLTGGEVASQFVVSFFEDEFKDRAFQDVSNDTESDEISKTELDDRNNLGIAFLTKAQERTQQTLKEKGYGPGSGTTFTGAIIEKLPSFRKTKYEEDAVIKTTIENGELWATIMHVGDSRAYVQRNDGTLELITPDEDILSLRLQTKFGSKLDKNALRTLRRALQRDLDGHTKDEQTKYLAEHYNFSANEIAEYIKLGNEISYGLGTGIDTPPFVTAVHLLPGERLILSTDGLDTLTDAEKAEVLIRCTDPETASRELVLQAALKAQREYTKEDDMTVVILQNDYKPREASTESI